MCITREPGPYRVDEGVRWRVSAPELRGTTSCGDALQTRRGLQTDAEGLVLMHSRCSARSLYLRYNVPTPRLSVPRARALLSPAYGLSLLVTHHADVVAHALATRDGPVDEPDVAVLVEDGWQRCGIGTRLLRLLAVSEARRGIPTLRLPLPPDNHAALRTVERAGLPTQRVRDEDTGCLRVRIDHLRQ